MILYQRIQPKEIENFLDQYINLSTTSGTFQYSHYVYLSEIKIREVSHTRNMKNLREYVTHSTMFCDNFYARAEIFKGQFCMAPNTVKSEEILKLKLLGKTSGSVECRSILIFYFLMVLDITKNFPSIYL